MEKNKKCKNCFYYGQPEGVCCCAESDEVADFTDKDFVCKHHENVEEQQKDGSLLL